MAGPGRGPKENEGPVMRRRQSHVWAVGLAVGLLWAWFPKDNLFSLGLILFAVGYRPPWLAVLVGLPIGAVTGLLLEPTALWLGERLLETPLLFPLLAAIHNQPILPWLGLNSSLMLGILSLSSWLVVPGYWLARELVEQLIGESVERRQRGLRTTAASTGQVAISDDPAMATESLGGGLDPAAASSVATVETERYLRWDDPQPAAASFLHRRAETPEHGLMLTDVLRWEPGEVAPEEHDAALAELPERLLALEELLAAGDDEPASLAALSSQVEADTTEPDVGQRALLVIDTAMDILRLDDSVGAGVPVPLGVSADQRLAPAAAAGGVGDAARPSPPPEASSVGDSVDGQVVQQRIDRPVASGDDRDAALPFLLGHLQRHRSVREDA
jgi:hypothetical protein